MGSFSNQFTKGFTLKVEWTESGVDVATNTSDLTVTAYLVAASGYYINSTAKKNISLTIDGTTYSGTCYVGLSKGETKELFKQTVSNIAHNADGSKSVAISCTLGIKATLNDTYFSNVSTSGTATLTTIARASQPSCVTYPENTQNVGEFGDTISIHMNRKSSAFTHTARYAFGTQTGTCINADTGKETNKDVTTGFRWTIPLSLMNLIPNGTSGSGTIYVDTYNGSTLVGTKSCGFTATVPTTADCYPKCSLTLEDITGIDKIYGSPVKGLSKIKVTVNTTLAYSSPIKSYEITANGRRYTASPATTDYLSGVAAVTATVKDGRGRPGTAGYTMNVQDYSAPTISALSVQRCNEDGTANKRGSHVKVKFSAAISSMSSKNTALYYLKYKKTSATAYTTMSLTDHTNKYSVNAEYIIAASPGSSYDIVVEAVDRHKTSQKSAKASTAVSIFSWRGFKTANGIEDGAGIGKVPEAPNRLEIGWDTIFYGKVAGTIFDALLPVGSIIMRYDHTNPGTLYPGTTWVRIYGAFPWFTDGNGQIGLTGGERTVTLTEKQIPSHNHGGTYTNAGTARTHGWLASGGSAMGYDTVSAGGGEAHNNMPPYIQISAWRRTA